MLAYSHSERLPAVEWLCYHDVVQEGYVYCCVRIRFVQSKRSNVFQYHIATKSIRISFTRAVSRNDVIKHAEVDAWLASTALDFN